MAAPTRRSLPSAPDPRLLAELEAAATLADMRSIQQRYGLEEMAAAWAHVSPVQRSALILLRVFGGTIAHDLSTSGF